MLAMKDSPCIIEYPAYLDALMNYLYGITNSKSISVSQVS